MSGRIAHSRMPESGPDSGPDSGLHSGAALSVAAGAFCISFAAPFVAWAGVEPTVSAFYRVFFGALFLGLWLAVRQRRFSSAGWPGSLLAGFFFALDLWFWHRSILWVSPGVATLLANLQVVLMGVIGVLIYREAAGWRLIAALLAALTGLWLLVGADWGLLEPRYRIGVVYGALTAFAYAAYLMTWKLSQAGNAGLAPVERLFQVSLCCAAVLWLFGVLEGNAVSLPSQQSLMVLAACGLFCQVLGWLLIGRGIPSLPASMIGLLLLLQPSLSLLWDKWFFGLQASLSQWLGAGLVLVGIYIGVIARRPRGRP